VLKLVFIGATGISSPYESRAVRLERTDSLGKSASAVRLSLVPFVTGWDGRKSFRWTTGCAVMGSILWSGVAYLHPSAVADQISRIKILLLLLLSVAMIKRLSLCVYISAWRILISFVSPRQCNGTLRHVALNMA